MNFRDPKNDQEWQGAANLAQFLLMVDSAKQYGLVIFTGRDSKIRDPINVERCVEIIRRARLRGIEPRVTDGMVKAWTAELMNGDEAELMKGDGG
jgi:hypothetical protein